jgi:hypothetical protein
MTPREEDILERIRARRTKSEEKTVTQDITKKDDHGSNLSTADLAQTGDVETGKEHRDVAGREIQEPASPRPPVRTPTPSQTSPAPTGSTPASSAAAGVARAMREDEESAGPLFSPDEAKKFRSQWENVQVGFVDEPRSAVEQADHLVAKAIKRLAEVFAEERQNLERQWDRGENVSTEDLRLALRCYRAFFERLLAI